MRNKNVNLVTRTQKWMGSSAASVKTKTRNDNHYVIVLRTATMEAAEQIRTHILNYWQDFITIYKGTTSQYTTLARVKNLFEKC